MGTVKVVPGSYLPLPGTQSYFYKLSKPARKGLLVNINLAGRDLRGVVVGPGKRPPKITLKPAKRESFYLPDYQLEVARDIADNYRASLSSVIKLMLPPTGKLTAQKKENNSGASWQAPKLTLTEEQARAYRAIRQGFSGPNKFLLYGITGSGKTEVYLKASLELLKRGQQVLMLVPEIAMTSHLAVRLKKYLGSNVIIWHSARTNKQKREDWAALARGRNALVIGPRSALFLPFPKLGLIVVDEEHDSSYKQDAREPHYHARALAAIISRRANCPVVYGSATPSIELWHQAQKGKIKKLTLSKRFGQAKLPKIDLVDVRGLPQKHPLSEPAIRNLRETLDQGKQSIVLLNRLGRAPFVQCRDCGKALRCKKCERPQVLHGRGEEQNYLACHYCDISTPLAASCPACSSREFLFIGHGTESLQAELKDLFPNNCVARLDRDSARSKKRLNALNKDLHAGNIDILVGTQLVAKGWDLENLKLVIVVDADQGLLVPDFRSHERTVQLLWQVAGRAGRRKDPGIVLIQTRQPNHQALLALQGYNFNQFMEAETKQRKQYGFPPFRRLLKLSIVAQKDAERQKKDKELIKNLNRFSASQGAGNSPTTIFPAQEHLLPGGKKTLQRVLATADPRKLFPFIPSDVLVDVDPEDYLA